MENKQEKTAKPYPVPPDGSLGLLAVGYRGLIAWREAKKKFKENQTAQENSHEQTKP